jgi:hypothetical protein
VKDPFVSHSLKALRTSMLGSCSIACSLGPEAIGHFSQFCNEG